LHSAEEIEKNDEKKGIAETASEKGIQKITLFQKKDSVSRSLTKIV
jgi:hypothetical protein